MILGRTLLLAMLAAPLLQGCVAAAIPIAAGAALSQAVKGKDRAGDVVPDQGVSNPAMAEGQGALAPGTRAVLLEGVTELPPPSYGQSDGAGPVYTEFADYALELAARDPLTDPVRPSALLARPGTLLPDTAPCRFVGNAVLIDLDPAEGAFDPALPVSLPALGDALDRLRDAEIEVIWGTAITADRAGDVRRWLRETALDPTGDDRLLLLRYPDDRKQTRRNEASKERCVIAMLGDERADFDELFDYLKNPDAALPLDALLGKGWFLAPVSAAAAESAAAAAITDKGPEE